MINYKQLSEILKLNNFKYLKKRKLKFCYYRVKRIYLQKTFYFEKYNIHKKSE